MTYGCLHIQAVLVFFQKKKKKIKNNVTELALCHSFLYVWGRNTRSNTRVSCSVLNHKLQPWIYTWSYKFTLKKQKKQQPTCPSSMSLCMPGRSCSVLLVLLMERLCDLRFCLTWRAAALFPLSTGITPQWRPLHTSYLKLSNHTAGFAPSRDIEEYNVCFVGYYPGCRM